MNILIRTNSSYKIGLGHLMRTLVLAKRYKDSNIIFACENLEGNFNHKVVEEGFYLVNIKSNSSDELISLIKDYSTDLLVVDSYDINYNFEKKIKQSTKVKVLSFDDTYERHYCDILLNTSISANKKKYKDLVPSHCEVLTGLKYSLVRDEFLYLKQRKKYFYKPKRVFLAMGGADHTNLNIKILEVLKEMKIFEVHVVTTTSNNSLKTLERYFYKNKFVKLYVNSNKIAEIMNLCDFAIITPSVTISEVLSLNMPFIAIKTALNQNSISKFLVRNRFFVLDKFNKKILKNKLIKMQKKKHYINIYNKIKRLNSVK